MDTTRDILYRVLSDILEKMAFLFAEEMTDQPDDLGPGTLLHASIEFQGAVSGRLEVAAPEDLCLVLAANAMGMEPDMLENLTPKDALGEFLNIVCGEFIEMRQGNQQIYHLTIPALAELPPAAWRELAARPDTVSLLVEDQPMLARAEVHDARPAANGSPA